MVVVVVVVLLGNDRDGLRRQGAVACVRSVFTRIQGGRPATAPPMRNSSLFMSCVGSLTMQWTISALYSHFLSDIPKTANGDVAE
jgi:hypothetical protein